MTSYITNVMRKAARMGATIRKRDEKKNRSKPRQGKGLREISHRMGETLRIPVKVGHPFRFNLGH